MFKKIHIRISVLVSILLIVVLVIIFPYCTDLYEQVISKDGAIPSSGLWYCKELKTQLCFIPITYPANLSLEEYETHTYIITEDGGIMCGIGIPVHGGIDLSVVAQDSNHIDVLGKTFFHGLCKSVDDSCFTVQGDNGEDYYFLRINEFSAQDYLDVHINQVDNLSTIQTQPKHIEVAAEYAIHLWMDEFGMTNSIEQEDLTVLVDPTSFHWLVSYPQSKSVSYNALMNDDGTFVTVWKDVVRG